MDSYVPATVIRTFLFRSVGPRKECQGVNVAERNAEMAQGPPGRVQQRRGGVTQGGSQAVILKICHCLIIVNGNR